MDPYSNEHLRGLVHDERIHRDAYRDPEIFELEMERIFARTWIYVGHDSQVPNPGDFFCTDIARQPVVMVRHTDGRVHVIYNRCGHRGTRVVNQESGNVKRFSCMYHGWTYETNGELAGVPLREDEDEDGFDFTDPSFAMMQLPRVDSYGGFVFASLSAAGPDLMTYMGEAKRGIDEIIAAAPDGEVELVAGCHRYQYRGNWKHQLENISDTYHTAFAHASTVGPDGRQFQRRTGDNGVRPPFYDENGVPVVLLLGVYGYPNGHTSCESMYPDEEEQAGGAWDEYKAIMVERYGEERAREAMKQVTYSMTFFPSVDILTVQNSVRVVIPKAVDETEVRIFPMRWKGAPEEIFADHIRFVNLTHAAASFIQTDDIETFRRAQEGLAADGNPWLLTTRGIKRDTVDNKGVAYGNYTTELAQRTHHRAWLDLMCAT